MMSSTLGAPWRGATDGGHQGVESLASSLMTPPNLGGGGGSCLPSMVTVALGEPGVPVTCWASEAPIPTRQLVVRASDNAVRRRFIRPPILDLIAPGSRPRCLHDPVEAPKSISTRSWQVPQKPDFVTRRAT